MMRFDLFISAVDWRPATLWLSRRAARLWLVERPELGLSQVAARCSTTFLRPWLESEERRSVWPGTHLLDSTAIVRSYLVTPRSIHLVLDAGSGTFNAWVQPALPEDLCLYRADGAPCLVTTAHEDYAEVRPDSQEARALVAALPGVRLVAVDSSSP